MPAVTVSDSRMYPTSGAATAALMGMPNGSVSGLTFSALPGKVLHHPQMPSHAALGACSAVGASCAVRVDAASGASSPFNQDFTGDPAYSAGMWVMAEIADPAAFVASALDTTASPAVVLAQSAGGVGYAMVMGLRKPSANPLLSSDLGMYCYDSVGATGAGLTEAGFCFNDNGSTVAFSAMAMGQLPLGRFFHIGHFMQSGIGGLRGGIVCGRLTSALSGDLSTPAAQHDSGWTFTLPGIAGIRWWVFEPESWRGTDWPVLSRVYHSPPDYALAFAYPTRFQGTANGSPWSTSASGASAQVSPPYKFNTGTRLKRERSRVTFAANGATRSRTLNFDLGELPFNRKGWFTLALPMIQARAKPVTVTIPNVAGTALFTITVDPTAGTVTCVSSAGGTGTCTFVAIGNRRVKVKLHVSSNSRVTMTCETSDSWSGTTAATNNSMRSCLVGKWVPQAIGRVKFDFMGDNGEIQEAEGLQGWGQPRVCGPDSYSHAETTSLDGSTAALALQACWDQNSLAPYSHVPDAHAACCLNPYGSAISGHVEGVWGRSGHKLTESVVSVLANMEWSRGQEIVIESGFANDTSRATNQATVESVAGEIAAAYAAWAAYAERTEQPLTVKMPAKGNSSEMNGTWTGPCFDRAQVLVERALAPYVERGVVTIVPRYAETIAGLHPTATEANNAALNTVSTGRRPVGSKNRRRDSRANIARRPFV